MGSIEDISEFNVIIQRGLFDRAPRQLIISEDFISFQNKIPTSTDATKFTKQEIAEYRYGINWIRGFEFTIGREFLFFIRNSENQVLKINFKTFYNIKKKASYQISNDILNALWTYHFGPIANELFNNLKQGKEITIGKATLTSESITVKEVGVLKDKITTFYWDDLESKDYRTYFAIYSSKSPSKLNATFSYLSDWNTGVLYSIVRTILNNRNADLMPG